jgi:hypothetical protein
MARQLGPAAAGAANTYLEGILNWAGGAQTPVVNIGNSSTAFTINCNSSNVFRVLMNGNVATLTISNPNDGQTVVLRLTQDGTGTRTMTWPAAVKWPNAIAGILSTAINSVDILTMTYFADTTFWYASLAKGFG